MSDRPRFSSLLALGMVTAAALALQVVLTRIFSSVLAYHFSFLAISLSLLGTGAGALVVYIWPHRFAADSHQELGKWSAWFAWSLTLLPLLLVQLDLAMSAAKLDPTFLVHFSIACVLASIPPFLSGVVVALAISRFSTSIGVVYAADLVGAGLGALIAVPVLWLGPAPNLVVAIGIVVAVAAVLFSATRSVLATAVSSAVAGVVLLAAAATTSVLYLDAGHGEGIGKPLGEHWTPLTRSFSYPNAAKEFAILLYDRAYAPVPIVKGNQLPDWKKLRTGPQSIGYELTGPGHTLVIGGGGGRDIYTALSEQQTVEVIELNEGVRMVVDDDLGHLSGRPYSRTGVSTAIGDGRSTLASRDTLYDQIHMGFTDTLSASAAQGFALSENNLYTLEAFDEYLDHLKPMGILNVSRLYRLVGDEALRIAILAQAALEARGIENPRDHMVVIKGTDFLGPPSGTVLLRLQPYSESELRRIEELAKIRGNGVVYGPNGGTEEPWNQLAATSLEEFCNSYPLDVCPSTDDKPFFFNMTRLSSLGHKDARYAFWASPFSMLLLTLAILAVLSLFAFVAPLRMARDASPPPIGSLGYFWCIGLGFLLVEITLIQRLVLFLGYPTYALSVVLFALLIFSGVGSWLTTDRPPKATLQIALATVVVLILATSFLLQPLLRALIWLPFAGRVLVAIALVAPIALCLGMAMPLGLSRLEALYPSALPYAWGVNGIASVLASVLGVVVAMLFGFTVAGLAAAACYAAALAHAVWGEWPASESA